MNEVVIIELTAIAVGILVVIIETVIIVMLRKHMKILEKNTKHTSELIDRFQKQIYDHLSHLNDHSHDLEQIISRIYEADTVLADEFRDHKRITGENDSDPFKIRVDSVVESLES